MPESKVTSNADDCKRVELAIKSAVEALRVAAQWVLSKSDDAVAREAYAMAMTGLRALSTKHPDAIAEVRAWSAGQRGAKDVNSDALAIVDIARAVEITASLRKHREDSAYAECRDDPFYSQAERDAVRLLRARLVRRHGEQVPSEDDLTDWIDRHAETGARGRLTTARIVANILARGRLLGSASDERQALERVTKVLARHAAKEAMENVGHGLSTD